MILVVDIQKGLETQSAESLVIGEITGTPLFVVLNKIDMIEESLRDKTVDKMTKKIRKVLEQTNFDQRIEIIPASAKLGVNIDSILSTIMAYFEKIKIRRDKNSSVIFAYDHCFVIRGSGNVLSGTMIQGEVHVNDVIYFPQLMLERKIKSMQMFKRSVEKGMSGDRLGICVTNIDSTLLERGLITTANQKSCLQHVSAVIIKFNKVKYFKRDIKSKSKFHCSVGHDTSLGTLTLFSSTEKGETFDWNSTYHYEDVFLSDGVEQQHSRNLFCLIEFDKSVICYDNVLLIGSKLDDDQSNKSCRIAFHGNISTTNSALDDKSSKENFLSNLKVYKRKIREGNVQRVVNDHELIVTNLFKKNTDISKFLGMRCQLGTGELGIIEDSFGKSGKVKICFKCPLEQSTIEILKLNKTDVKAILQFKKSVFNKMKNEMIQ